MKSEKAEKAKQLTRQDWVDLFLDGEIDSVTLIEAIDLLDHPQPN